MNRLLVICGPTATGKTSLGISLAEELDGEIVSADSRQVYRGMDIGTGKNTNKQISKFQIGKSMPNDKFQIGHYAVSGVKIWLYDVVEPDCRFNVADYVQCASVVIKDIWRRGKFPIIVGGTGFYIKGLIDGIDSLGVPPDWKLREKFGDLEIEKLREKLNKLDPGRLREMNESDRQNPRRLVRAIEIALQVKSEKFKVQSFSPKLKISKSLWIGLKAPNEILYQRIDKRVDERIEQGIKQEIKKLLKKGFNWENSALGVTMGYQEWQSFFEGKAVKEETIQRWKFHEHHYARRQMTWFRKDKRINWFGITKRDWKGKVAKLINEWYTDGNHAEKN